MSTPAFSSERSARGHVSLRALQAGLILVVGLAGCSRSAAPTPTMPDPLRVGVSLASGRPRAAIEASFAPLVRHLGESLGVASTLVLTDTAAELRQRFHRGEIDLADFGGVDFVLAEQQDGAVPLAKRTLDANFFFVVIARPGLEGKFPDDFRGRSFVFGGVESNTGNRMPRHFFAQMQLEPEKFFGSVRQLRSHIEVITAIEAGEADAGVVNGPMFRRRRAQNPDNPRPAREVWVSPTYTDAVWAVPARLTPACRNRVLDVFLALDAQNPAHAGIMWPLAARGFVPATRAEFDHVRAAADSLVRKARP